MKNFDGKRLFFSTVENFYLIRFFCQKKETLCIEEEEVEIKLYEQGNYQLGDSKIKLTALANTNVRQIACGESHFLALSSTIQKKEKHFSFSSNFYNTK